MKEPYWKCDVCGWEGYEPQMIPGVLWDYEEHESCPVCWEKDVIDNTVEVIAWHEKPIKENSHDLS